jgi:hypothetical protein
MHFPGRQYQPVYPSDSTRPLRRAVFKTAGSYGVQDGDHR